jgi:hypothetical protein
MRKIGIVLAALVAGCAHQQSPAPAASQAKAAITRKYVMVMGANRAGAETVTTNGDDRTIDFEFNDRGRGPKTHTVLTVDGRGIPISEVTTGNDYLKAPVDERLNVYGGKAHFVNKAEHGDGDAHAFYASMYGPPEEAGLLARALLASGGRLNLLPSGEATIRKDQTLDLGTIKVTRYEISGLGFTPSGVWLDDNNDFFATVNSWSSIIRDGYVDAIPKLLPIDEAADHERGIALAKLLTEAPPAIAITHARLFDSDSMKTIPNVTIVVRGLKIESVGENVAIPADARVIDAAGKTVIPGLWDMHVHLGDVDGLLDVASGVTTVRDLANDIDYVTGLQKNFNDGTLIGPRVILAGFMDGPGPYAGPTKVLVDNEDDIRKAIDRYTSLGYVQIKIYSSMKPELVPFITKYAHSKGLRVSGHIPAFMYAEDAVREGYDEIQHANMLLLNFLRDVKDTRTPARFTAIAEQGASIDLHSPEATKFFDLLVEHKTVIDPTLAVFEEMFLARPGQLTEAGSKIADRLPPQVRRGFLAGGLPVDASKDETYKAGFAKMIELVRMLHDRGIRIVAGTDDMAGFTLHRELELYAKAGIPNAEILQLATLGAARVMGRDSDLGSIVPGKTADLVIIDGDPVANISDLRKPVWVISKGKLFESEKLYAALGVH